MALRFTLLEETSGKGAERVKVPRLRRWRSSRPGVKAFGYRQGFRNLPENASHRVRVDYRWYAPDGTEVAARQAPLARAVASSSSCRTCSRGSPRSSPTNVPGVVRYLALVGNTGKAVADRACRSG